MEVKVYKQGIELEMFVIQRDEIDIDYDLHENITEDFKEKISSRFYFDDGKPEYPSRPYSDLRGLYDNLKTTLDYASEIANAEYDADIMLIGTYPFNSEREFASGHIHTSLRKPDNSLATEREILTLRNRLYNAQPLIACISQNSPIIDGMFQVKDTRLYYSEWAEFTEFGDTSDSHYLALAVNQPVPDVATLEVRIPSSSNPVHLIAIANVIKALLNRDDYPVAMEYTPTTWERILKYGAKAIVPLKLPKTISYYGFKYTSVNVEMSTLFKIFIDEYKDELKDGIASLPVSIQDHIWKLYQRITEGYTISDYVIEHWKSLDDKWKLLDLYVKMSNKPIWVERKPSRVYSPILENKITYEELMEIARDLEHSYEISDDVKEVYNALQSLDNSSKRIMAKILSKISIEGEMFFLPFSSRDELVLGTLMDLEAIEEVSHDRYGKGKRFELVAQVLEDYFV